MANPEHVEILKQGVESWNEWRTSHPRIRPNLKGSNLSSAAFIGANLSGADLSGANLNGADLSGGIFRGATLKGTTFKAANLSYATLNSADLRDADLSGGNFSYATLSSADLSAADLSDAIFRGATLRDTTLKSANLSGATLTGVDFIDANLSRASLIDANLTHADLSSANLSGADLISASLNNANLNGANLSKTTLVDTNFSGANLSSTKFDGAYFRSTVLTNTDLSLAQGLSSVDHLGPSSIGIDTLYRSKGQIPEEFMRGCGVPDSFITQAKALIGAEEGIQFYSCFISYSTKDDEFARRLHSRLQQEKVRVWFAPHDIQGGRKLHEQIDEAIRVYDKLLILLSPNSLQSNWVMTELRKARKAERKTGQRKLFPVGLVDYPTLQEWECFDADGGQDLAVEVREYYIPDFTNWKDHDAFEAAFDRLLKDLRANAPAAGLAAGDA